MTITVSHRPTVFNIVFDFLFACLFFFPITTCLFPQAARRSLSCSTLFHSISRHKKLGILASSSFYCCDLILSSVKPGDEKNSKDGKRPKSLQAVSFFCRLPPSFPTSLPLEHTKTSLISQPLSYFSYTEPTMVSFRA